MQLKGVTTTQVASEYEEGQNFLRTKKLRQVRQLILMNNLRRGDQNISTTMLFSYFNRVFSNLYSDKNTITFLGSDDSEYRTVEMLRKLQENDTQEMEKALIDYDWLWDTLFFARGYCETLNFDTKRKILQPEILNPLMLVYDPFFSNVQSWRYYGKWIMRSGTTLKELMDKKVITGIKTLREITPGVDPELWDYKVQRDQARDANPAAEETDSPNKIYQIYEHATYNKNGEKVMVWTDKSFSKILRAKVLDLRDDPDGKRSLWPLVTKEAFREPHSSVPISVPDVVEDKHRALAVLYNLAYLAAKDEANPIYAYDGNKVVDKSQLLQRQIAQHIETDGDPDLAIKPLRKNAALSNSLMAFMGILKSEAAEVAGTSVISTPQKQGKKTATDAAILQQIADLTPSLQTKVLAIGEREFWGHWYQRYMRYKNAGDEKIIRVTNANGESFEKIELDNIKTKYPPKVLVLSSKDAEFKETMARRELSNQFPILGKILTGRHLANFLKFVYFPKFIQDSTTIEMMIPKSMDEIKAEQENELLMKDKVADIHRQDDDETHLYIHYRAKKTAATWAHIMAHEMQRADKLAQAEAEAAKQASNSAPPAANGAPGGQPAGQGGKQPTQGKKRANTSPNDAVAPLKEIMQKAGAPVEA